MTADFARTLLVEENLGQGGHTDMLAISFSATDYIGHAFGPQSLEAEDNLYWLDQTLDELFRVIDQRVGLERTLIVLSSDHGVASIPEVLLAKGIPAGRHKPSEDMLRINEALKLRFQTDENLLNDNFKPPSFYLNRDAVARASLDVDEVAVTLADMLEALPGISHAIARKDFVSGMSFVTPAEQRLAMAFHPQRSGGRPGNPGRKLVSKLRLGILRGHTWLAPRLRYTCTHYSRRSRHTGRDIRSAGPRSGHRSNHCRTARNPCPGRQLRSRAAGGSLNSEYAQYPGHYGYRPGYCRMHSHWDRGKR